MSLLETELKCFPLCKAQVWKANPFQTQSLLCSTLMKLKVISCTVYFFSAKRKRKTGEKNKSNRNGGDGRRGR